MSGQIAEYSIWLMPEAMRQAELTSLVRALAHRFGTEPFIPHVTIQGDIKGPQSAVNETVAAMAARWPAQRWRVCAVDGTDFFFRSLFLRFPETPAYIDFKATSQARSATDAGLSLFPHLSLAYGVTDPAQKRAAIAELAGLNADEIVFDRLVVARASSNVAIADWAVLSAFPLAG